MPINDNIIEIAKFCFNLRKIGRNKKNAKDGIVKMTVPYDKSITFWELFVSQYNQINASRDVKGIEIIIAAKKEDFLATSDTITIMIAVRKVLIR